MSIRVQALTRGYYGGRIIEPDQIFYVEKEEHLSSVWMEILDEVAEVVEPAKKVARARAVKPPAAPVDFS